MIWSQDLFQKPHQKVGGQGCKWTNADCEQPLIVKCGYGRFTTLVCLLWYVLKTVVLGKVNCQPDTI